MSAADHSDAFKPVGRPEGGGGFDLIGAGFGIDFGGRGCLVARLPLDGRK